jgi:hypothetical protein
VARVSPPSHPIRSQASVGSGSVASISEYSGSSVRRLPGRVAVQPSVARTTTSDRTVPRVVSARPGRMRVTGVDS